MNFFNTTGLAGQHLKNAKSKAQSQSKIIMNFFEENRMKSFTPSELWINLFDVDSTPITSIRRSISTLTRKGMLIKTNVQDTGVFGRPEHKWRIK